MAWIVVHSKSHLLTHLGCPILCRSLARAELPLAVALPSIIVIAIIAACARAHHAAARHCVVHGTWVVGGGWTGGWHFVLVS